MDWGYKAMLTTVAVALVLLVAQAVGRRAAGILAGLPDITAPALLWVASELGPAFAARTAVGSIAACGLMAVFALVYGRNGMENRIQRLCIRLRRMAGPGKCETSLSRWCVLAFALTCTAPHASPTLAASEKPPRWIALPYSKAVLSFRQARFPEAYGRFVAVAEMGYAPAARHALWMCEHGPELFGRPFDCAPHEIEAWAVQTNGNPREALRRIYPGVESSDAPGRARR